MRRAEDAREDRDFGHYALAKNVLKHVLSYWADSAFLSAAGIPTVLYGPDGDGAHADVEWASLSGTVAVAAALTRVTSHLA